MFSVSRLRGQTRRLAFLALAACLSLTLLGGETRAGTLSFDLSYEFSGSGTGTLAIPVNVLFQDAGVDTVTLTITAPAIAGTKIDGIYLNYAPGSAAGLTIVNSGSSTAPTPTISKGLDAYKADGDGFFDIKLDYPTSGNGFAPGEVSILTITGTGINAMSFNDVSVNGPPGKNGFHAAAHVLAIPPTGGSGWYAESIVPEPSTIALALAGFGSMGLLKLRRRNRQPRA